MWRLALDKDLVASARWPVVGEWEDGRVSSVHGPPGGVSMGPRPSRAAIKTRAPLGLPRRSRATGRSAWRKA